MKKLFLFFMAALIMSPALNAEPKPMAKNVKTMLTEKVEFKKKPRKNKKRKPAKGPKKIR